MRERIKGIIRIVALFVTAINAVLAAKGISPLPFDEEVLSEAISDILFWAAALWAWWKNNNMTAAAISAQDYLRWFKRNHIEEVICDDETGETD